LKFYFKNKTTNSQILKNNRMKIQYFSFLKRKNKITLIKNKFANLR
jgi:hypothetical protein